MIIDITKIAAAPAGTGNGCKETSNHEKTGKASVKQKPGKVKPGRKG